MGESNFVDASILEENTIPQTQSVPILSAPATGTSSQLPNLDNPKFTLPDYIVPHSYLTKAGDSVPFMLRRKRSGAEVIVADKPDAMRLNGPFQPGGIRDLLPPFALFYMLSHGWDDHVIEKVGVAHVCEANLVGFLKAMTHANIPLAEASFLWYALQL